MLKPGQDEGEVEKLIYEEFDRVKTDGVTTAEMQKVLIQDRLQQAESLDQHNEPRADAGPVRRVLSRSGFDQHDSRKYSEITPSDIQRVAREYLGATQRTVVLTNPKAQAQGGPAQ
jgi:predicted Zn-dependent peptidase